MDWLEEELKRALVREEPPAGFEARVRRRMVRAFPRWVAAAAAVMALLGGTEAYRWHCGQLAKQQVMLAMRIAGSKLNRLQSHFRGDMQ